VAALEPLPCAGTLLGPRGPAFWTVPYHYHTSTPRKWDELLQSFRPCKQALYNAPPYAPREGEVTARWDFSWKLRVCVCVCVCVCVVIQATLHRVNRSLRHHRCRRSHRRCHSNRGSSHCPSRNSGHGCGKTWQCGPAPRRSSTSLVVASGTGVINGEASQAHNTLHTIKRPIKQTPTSRLPCQCVNHGTTLHTTWHGNPDATRCHKHPPDAQNALCRGSCGTARQLSVLPATTQRQPWPFTHTITKGKETAGSTRKGRPRSKGKCGGWDTHPRVSSSPTSTPWYMWSPANNAARDACSTPLVSEAAAP
jgi:hypothetical protein